MGRPLPPSPDAPFRTRLAWRRYRLGVRLRNCRWQLRLGNLRAALIYLLASKRNIRAFHIRRQLADDRARKIERFNTWPGRRLIGRN